MAMELPLGFKFDPTDEEIITEYLRPKIEGLLLEQREEITEERIYARLPWDLNWDHVDHLFDYERYFFVKRTPAASHSTKRAKRSLVRLRDDLNHNGDGFWQFSRKFEVHDARNRLIGHCNVLNFFVYKEDRIRKNALKTQWIMYEYSLADTQQFQEWVVCRIKDKEREKNPINCSHNNIHGAPMMITNEPEPEHKQQQIIIQLPPDYHSENDHDLTEDEMKMQLRGEFVDLIDSVRTLRRELLSEPSLMELLQLRDTPADGRSRDGDHRLNVAKAFNCCGKKN